jgi:hypothetical protein
MIEVKKNQLPVQLVTGADGNSDNKMYPSTSRTIQKLFDTCS